MAKKNTFHFILLGHQGSGKGTQAKLLAQKFNLVHLEIGNILRTMVKTKSPLGRKVAQRIDQGKLVPFYMIVEIVKDKLKAISKNKGIVFDGTPRRMPEVAPLEKALKKHGRQITHVFFIWISQRETIKRLSKRRSCEKCGTLFISGKTLSVRAIKCPKCQGKIIQREDDTPVSIRKRLIWSHQKTGPVIESYRRQGKLIEINGEQSIQKVFKDILSYL